jgi:hypothetical protein
MDGVHVAFMGNLQMITGEVYEAIGWRKISQCISATQIHGDDALDLIAGTDDFHPQRRP